MDNELVPLPENFQEVHQATKTFQVSGVDRE